MATITQSTFSNFMDAVEAYYGKNIWEGITSESAFTNADFASKITQVPNVSATYLKDGSVAYYKYNGEIAYSGLGQSNLINSNTGSVTYASSVRVPANTSVNAQTGVVSAESGMSAVSGGSRVLSVVGEVAGVVGAVMCGIQLGAKIDSILYNANPDFWDENGMKSLDPTTWDSICTTQAGKDVFNMIFGIDKTSGETQGYMDENALAYVALYMASKGAFGGGESQATLVDTSPLNYPSAGYYPQPVIFSHPSAGDYVMLYPDPSYGDQGYLPFRLTNYSDPVYLVAMKATTTTYYFLLFSKSAFRAGIGGLGLGNSTNVTRNGTNISFYSITIPSSEATDNNFLVPVWNATSYSGNLNNQHMWDIGYILLYGNVTTVGVEGIEAQDGATLPAGITAGMTVAEALQYLKTNYPDIWSDAIENDVVQPDGTVKTRTYVPVGVPDNIPKDQITGQLQPTGGVNTQQGNTTVSDTSNDELIQTLLNILNAQNPQNPTQQDTETPTNYPDTGSGTTPSIVVPAGSAHALYSVYNPSEAEVNSFGAWLWSNNFVDQLLKLFNDPMQAIIGLHKIFAQPSISGTGNIYVGYLDSGVSSNLVDDQYTSVDCGTVNLYEYFGNILDYSQTEIYIYLPFIGIVRVNVDDVMRSSINVVYKVDVLTGACLASVLVTRDSSGGQLYTYAGDCAVQYPLSSGSYMGIVGAIAGLAGAVVGTIATGGAMLPVAIGAGASAISSAKTRVEHSGALSGNAGAMGIKKPYLIIRRPQTTIADNFDNYDGVANNVYGVLGSYTGFTRVRYVNLENIPATGEELSLIEEILKNGIII